MLVTGFLAFQLFGQSAKPSPQKSPVASPAEPKQKEMGNTTL